MKKKIVALLMCCALAAGALGGCGNGQGAQPSSQEPEKTETQKASEEKQESKSEEPSKEAEEEVTIKVSHWDVETSAKLPLLLEGFAAKYPNIKVEIIDIPSADYTTKLSVMLNGGSDLDAFWIKDGDTTKSLAEKGQLADLTSYISGESLDLTAFNGLAERFNMDGKTVALPASTGYYVLYYNKDIFDAANEPYPSNDMTWKEFEEVAARITSGTGADKDYGALFHTWQACVQNWGVADGKHTIMDQDLSFFKPYYEMALRMQEEGSVMDYATLKTSNLSYNNLFMQGNIGMLPMGTWFIATLLDKKAAGETDVNWGLARLPHADDVEAGYTVGSVTPIAVNEASGKKDAAWKFIEYVCSEEGAKAYAEAGEFPSRANDDTLASIANGEGMPEGALEAIGVKNISLDRPMESKVAEVNQMLGEQHSLIMLGEVSVDDGIAEMNKLTKEIQGQ